eukprot:XP_015577781.1 chromo domain-containing protein LHP1 isoform X2 [Ricinus communis]
MKGKRKAAAAAAPTRRSPTNTAALSSDSSMEMDDSNNNKNNMMVEVVVVQGGNVGDEQLKKDCVLDTTTSTVNNNNVEEDEDDDDNDNEEEEDDDDEEEEKKGEGGVEEERPKLDEGFFEIEAIRRKRVRKGQLQYLIKWRGWPEAANTWEPLENLQSCSDVIDAFEESLRSGKSSRKRKRKYGVTNTQPKKKQSRSSAGYNVTGLDINVVDKLLPSASLNNKTSADSLTGSGHQGENNGDVSIVKIIKKADENGYINGSKQTLDKNEDNEYDPKLSELRGIVSTNDVSADNKLLINFQEDNTPGSDGPRNGLPKVDYADAVQNSRRTGAKRRKSGSVKRFKKESVMCEPVCLQSSPFFLQPSPLNVSVGLGGTTALGIENGNLAGSNSSYKPVGENSITITKIIKPIGFSASVMDDIQDVLVTFVAMRFVILLPSSYNLGLLEIILCYLVDSQIDLLNE